MRILNRNITIVTLILVLAVLAGYLVWIRSRQEQEVIVPKQAEVGDQIESAPATPSAESTMSAEATSTPTPTIKTATQSATRSGTAR